MTQYLQSVVSIQSGLFVRINVQYYKNSPTATPQQQILRFSDHIYPVTINGEEYLGLGRLMGITATASNLRTTADQLSISISGIPNTSIAEIINSRIKGCPVEIYRVIFNPQTGQKLEIPGNPAGRFFGIINNYSLQEDYDNELRTSLNTIVMTCSSISEILSNKVSGRRTNPLDQKKFYPGDLCFDRVTALVGSNFNFGAPQ